MTAAVVVTVTVRVVVVIVNSFNEYKHGKLVNS